MILPESLRKNEVVTQDILYYQVDCIHKHPELPILPFRISVQKEMVLIETDLSGTVNLGEIFDKNKLTKQDCFSLLKHISETITLILDLVLSPACLDLSVAGMQYLSESEVFLPEHVRFFYLPVKGELSKDPLRSFCDEILDNISSESTDRTIFHESVSFSEEEQQFLSTWSLANFDEGKKFMNPRSEEGQPVPCTEQKQSHVKEVFNGVKIAGGIRPMLKMNPHHLLVLSGIFGGELLLICIAFILFRMQNHFQNPITPVVLVSVILGCCGVTDLFLLYGKKSPFYLPPDKKSEKQKEILSNREEGSIFTSKEEKTVLLDQPDARTRIAMLCSGVPGTLEENTGMKAYILVDDFLVGRDGGKVDFKINCISVGRIHARITRRENSFFIEDLDSRNGTYLDQKKLKKNEEMRLPDQCKLCFADQDFYFIAN